MHRDIKPDNIMLREPDDLSSVVIIDFGFASYVGQQQMNLRSCGSPGYMAPEVINNEKNYDAQCDIFSVGAILYEMYLLLLLN
jgi:serine/threonine protein kinase